LVVVPDRSDRGSFEVAWEVRRFDSIDSTNSYLMREALSGAPEGVVAVADYQSAGRGRLERRWESPPGASLLVSVLLRPRLEPDRLARVLWAASLAMVEACESKAGVDLAIKWPNDLIVPEVHPFAGGRKVAGILSEAQFSLDPPAVVVGVGVNVNWPTRLLQDPSVGGNATSLNVLCGHDVDRDGLLDCFLERLGEKLASAGTTAGAARLLNSYRARCATLGAAVEVQTSTALLVGWATSLDETGALLLDTHAGTKRIVSGDVVRVRGNERGWTR
jgi:BirA family biotin operon repressor/biotin-[acetyl-CoA-carboxylase] ligase